jgi:Bacterial SH3 domain
LMALQRMQEINAAYQTLMSSVTRSSNEVVTQDEMVEKVTLRYPTDRMRYVIAAAVLCALAIVGSVSILVNRDAINRGFDRAPVRGAVEARGIGKPPSNEMARPTLVSEMAVVPPTSNTHEKTMSMIKIDCRVRAMPNLKAAMVGKLAKGSQHHVLEERGGWRRIQVEGRDGWVSNMCWAE